MFDTVLDFLANGLTRATWGEMVVYMLVVTQLTIFTVTLYYHRSATHRGVDFHWTLNGFFRFWGWLTTGMVVKEWVAIHRKHHAKVETEEDPHSPQIFGIKKVFLDGVSLYREASYNKADMEKYGRGTPDDWFERHVFGKHPYWGPVLMAVINVSLFGVIGMALWAIQMLWIPFWAAGFVNGIGHWWGYRNFETADRSTNLVPIGLWIGGEELHNNHHAFPSSARFALRRYEFDAGWLVIRLLSKLGLANVKRIARPRATDSGCAATMSPRVSMATHFFRDVMLPAAREEALRRGLAQPSAWLRRALADGGRWLRPRELERFNAWLEDRPMIRVLSDYRARLDALLAERRSRREILDDWIRSARASDIDALRRFAASLEVDAQSDLKTPAT